MWDCLRLVLGALLLSSAVVAAQPSEGSLADRIVAVVDDDPILASDLERVIALELVAPIEGESDDEFRARALDRLIEEKLRFHEIDRYGFQELPLDEVDRAFADIRDRFASRAEFEARLSDVGLTEERLREILARRLLVLVFVEERLGPRVFVSSESIREYYEEVLVPEMRRRGEETPELAKVRESIRAVLREARLNQEIDLWTQELYGRADVVRYLDERPETLPPLVNDG